MTKPPKTNWNSLSNLKEPGTWQDYTSPETGWDRKLTPATVWIRTVAVEPHSQLCTAPCSRGGGVPHHTERKNRSVCNAAKSSNVCLKLRVYQWINKGQSRLRGPAAVVPSALCETEASSAVQQRVLLEDFCITRQTFLAVWLEN